MTPISFPLRRSSGKFILSVALVFLGAMLFSHSPMAETNFFVRGSLFLYGAKLLFCVMYFSTKKVTGGLYDEK